VQYILSSAMTGNNGQQLIVPSLLVVGDTSDHHLLLNSSSPTQAGPTGVQYFGFYSADVTDTGSQPTAHTNLYQAGSLAQALAAKAAGLDSLLVVEEYFPGLYTAKVDWKTQWDPVVPLLRALLANKTIIGFNLGE
jgi:hypothetical protein